MKKNIYLITGAAGFVGSHLVEHLLREGVDRKNLRLFVYKDESLINLPGEDFEIIRGDIRNYHDIKKAVSGASIIYHLAAWTRDGKDAYTTNFIGTKNLIKACRSEKIKKFVFFSTIAVFGLPAFVGERVNIDETSPKRVEGDYASSKYRAECEIVKANRDFGLPYVIIRPTTVYGPRDKAGIYQLFMAIKKGYFFRIGNGKNRVDYVYVTDLVKGARQAELSSMSKGDFILGSGEPVQFKEIINSVATCVKSKVPNFYLPKILGLLIAYPISNFSKVFKLDIPVSPDRIRVMTTNCFFNCQKAKDEIGYNPRVSIRNGIKKVAASLD